MQFLPRVIEFFRIFFSNYPLWKCKYWPLLIIRWPQHIAGHTSTLTTEVHICLQDSKTFLNTQSLSDVLSPFPDHEPKTHRCATVGPWLNSEHPDYVLQGPWPQTAWRGSVNSQCIWKLKLFSGFIAISTWSQTSITGDHLTKDLRCHLWGLAWNINQFDADLWIFIAPLAFCARTRGAGSCLAQQKAPSAAAASAKWDFYWNDSSKSAARRDKMLGRWQQLPNVLRRRGGGGCELRTEKELRQEARYQQWVSVCINTNEGKNHRWLLLLFLSHWIWFHGSCDFQSFRSSSRSRSVHASKHKQKHSNVCIGLFLSGKRCDGFTCHEVVTLCSQHRTCK